MKYASIYGDERRNFLEGCYSEEKLILLSDILSGSQIEMIRCTWWNNYRPWHVWTRQVNNDFLIFVYKGNLGLETPAEITILERGDFLMLPSRVPHAFYLPEGESEVEHCIMHCHINSLKYINFLAQFSTPYRSLKDPDATLEQLRKVAWLFSRSEANGRIYGSNLIQNIIIDQLMDCDDFSTEFGVKDIRISQALSYINNHFSSPISIDDIAEFTGLKSAQFRRLFKENTGTTPHECLKSYRLKKACNLLQQTTLNLNAIIQEAGFSSVDYFCQTFKKELKCTPTEYRGLIQF